MFDILNKVNILLLLIILWSSCNNKKGDFIVEDVMEGAFIKIPGLDSRDYEVVEGNHYEGLYIYKSRIDSTSVQIVITHHSKMLEGYLDEKYYTYDRIEPRNVVQLNINYSYDRIVNKKLYINTINDDQYENIKYLIWYDHCIISRGKYICIDIKKEFNKFDIVLFYNWAKQFNDIEDRLYKKKIPESMQ